MSKDSQPNELPGESRELTVLFADIKGFTAFSETLSAGDLKQLLNRFFTPMSEVIFEHRGTVDKYVGDTIMAFWGAPLRDPHHARHAVNAALAMLERVRPLNAELAAQDLPRIDIGVGLNTGVMHVGDMGSEYRHAYTVLGEPVNLALRLRGLSRFYGVPVVIGERTFQQVRDDYLCRELDLIRIRGKIQPVHVYHPIALNTQADKKLRRELQLFHQALELFRARDWNGARVLLEQLEREYGGDTVLQIYLKRIEWLTAHPPGERWDGVFERRVE